MTWFKYFFYFFIYFKLKIIWFTCDIMMYRHNPRYLIFLLWIVQEQREFRLLNLLLPLQNSASISCRPLSYCNSNRRYLYRWYPSRYFFHTTSVFFQQWKYRFYCSFFYSIEVRSHFYFSKLVYNLYFSKLVYNLYFSKLVYNLYFSKLVYNFYFSELDYNLYFSKLDYNLYFSKLDYNLYFRRRQK